MGITWKDPDDLSQGLKPVSILFAPPIRTKAIGGLTLTCPHRSVMTSTSAGLQVHENEPPAMVVGMDVNIQVGDFVILD